MSFIQSQNFTYEFLLGSIVLIEIHLLTGKCQYKNEDGSFTFGYIGADGSFRKETRGADCITRGKYDIDPESVKKEYIYWFAL